MLNSVNRSVAYLTLCAILVLRVTGRLLRVRIHERRSLHGVSVWTVKPVGRVFAGRVVHAEIGFAPSLENIAIGYNATKVSAGLLSLKRSHHIVRRVSGHVKGFISGWGDYRTPVTGGGDGLGIFVIDGHSNLSDLSINSWRLSGVEHHYRDFNFLATSKRWILNKHSLQTYPRALIRPRSLDTGVQSGLTLSGRGIQCGLVHLKRLPQRIPTIIQSRVHRINDGTGFGSYFLHDIGRTFRLTVVNDDISGGGKKYQKRESDHPPLCVAKSISQRLVGFCCIGLSCVIGYAGVFCFFVAGRRLTYIRLDRWFSASGLNRLGLKGTIAICLILLGCSVAILFHGLDVLLFVPAHSDYRPAVTVSSLAAPRSEEHTSELQSPCNLVCRLLLE